MFDSIFETQGKLDITTVLVAVCTALVLGLVLSIVYVFTHKKEGYVESIPTTLIVLPIVVAVLIMIAGTSVAGALSLAGIFTLVRFRSEQNTSKDLTYILASVAGGICSGVGYIGYGIVVVSILIVVILVIYFTKYGQPKSTDYKLKILVPEDLNYEHAFDEVFEKYNVKAYLDKVRTADFGTVYELVFRMRTKKDFMQQAFIDEIRVRNGNLNITLTLSDNVYTKNV